ncbi:MAG: hypothetical protein B7Y80_20605 [Hyphomicrobium sp. 32-62-53]|nr:MAG: hypothetical protein B7Y80_20605 [Hyphomicrobium sp. 32-62-53]
MIDGKPKQVDSSCNAEVGAMSKKSKKRRSYTNMPLPPSRPPASDDLDREMDQMEERTPSASEPAVAAPPVWTQPHIESNEVSGDPFITDLPVSEVANVDGPTAEGASEEGSISALASSEDAVVTAVDVVIVPEGHHETGFEQRALESDIVEVETPAPALETIATASHPSASRPQQDLRTDVGSLLDGHRRIADQILANIETNERAALQAAGALLQARSLPEIMTVQLRFSVEQFAALGVQSAELVGLIGKIYSTSFTSTQSFSRQYWEDSLGQS